MIEAILQQYPNLTRDEAEIQIQIMKLSCTDSEIESLIESGWIPMVMGQ